MRSMYFSRHLANFSLFHRFNRFHDIWKSNKNDRLCLVFFWFHLFCCLFNQLWFDRPWSLERSLFQSHLLMAENSIFVVETIKKPSNDIWFWKCNEPKSRRLNRDSFRKESWTTSPLQRQKITAAIYMWSSTNFYLNYNQMFSFKKPHITNRRSHWMEHFLNWLRLSNCCSLEIFLNKKTHTDFSIWFVYIFLLCQVLQTVQFLGLLKWLYRFMSTVSKLTTNDTHKNSVAALITGNI